MKLLLFLAAGLITIIVLMFAIGSMLPKAHTAAVRIALRAPAQNVYNTIADVERGTGWRTGLKQVEVLEREPLRWRETADWGKLTFVREDAVPPSRIVARIADESEGFGGTWTYDIATSPNQVGSTVTITEHGTVANPMFRFMSRFIFGHYRSLETYARDLARHLGESAEPARVS
jgi:hypothetical protein